MPSIASTIAFVSEVRSHHIARSRGRRAVAGLFLTPLLTSAAQPSTGPTIGELRDAVATVNDWRAILLFISAIVLLQFGERAFANVWKARSDEKISEALLANAKAMRDQATAIDRLRFELDFTKTLTQFRDKPAQDHTAGDGQ